MTALIHDSAKTIRVPVTLLTGFLGAGKTTLLNRMLSDASAGRIAVIMNEFGEAGLDHDLIEEVSEDIVLMQSGCLCCSIRGDLSVTFDKLIKRRDAGELSFDRIVIETTGIADPGPILQTMVVDPFLGRNARMDGVVTVVDAVNGQATLDAQFEAVSQVAMADLVILSKTDIAPPQATTQLVQRLQQTNPTAQILRAQDQGFTPALLWGVSGMRDDTSQHQAVAWTTPIVAPAPLDNLSGLAPAPIAATSFRPHDSDIASISVIVDEPLDEVAFDRWFDMLVTFKGRDLLRVKGILFLQGVDTPFVFHGVQQIFERPIPIRNWSGTDRRTRIVLIGRNLNGPEIQHSLTMLHVVPDATARGTHSQKEPQS